MKTSTLPPPTSLISPAAVSVRPRSRPVIATLAPNAASPRAVARPMPDVAPVTRTVWPAIGPRWLCSMVAFLSCPGASDDIRTVTLRWNAGSVLLGEGEALDDEPHRKEELEHRSRDQCGETDAMRHVHHVEDVQDGSRQQGRVRDEAEDR